MQPVHEPAIARTYSLCEKLEGGEDAEAPASRWLLGVAGGSDTRMAGSGFSLFDLPVTRHLLD